MTRDFAPLPSWHLAIAAIALVAIVAGIVAQLWIPLAPPIPGEFSDSVDYLVFADYFCGAFSGKLTPNVISFFAVTRFPPLFPLALCASGAGLHATLNAYWLTAAFTIACFGLAAVWLVRECKSLAGGLLVAAAFALAPGLHLLTLNPVSEPMFLAMTLSTLLWSGRVEAGRGSLLTFALFAGLLPLCRMAGIAMVIAIALWLHLRRVRSLRGRAIATAAMILPVLSWFTYRRLMPVSLSYSDVAGLDHLIETFGGWSAWMLGQPRRIADAYIESVSPWAHAPGALIALFGFAFSAGWWLRIRRAALDAIALTFYLGLIFCWPYPSETPRLIVVTLPMAGLCLWEAARWLFERIPATSANAAEAAAFAIAATVVAVSMPFMVEASGRALAPMDAELEPFRRSASFFRVTSRASALELAELNARVAAAMDETAHAIPQGECVYTFFPNALYAHGPSLDVRPMPFPPRDGKATPDQFSDCRHVLVTYQTSWQLRQPLLYPMRQADGWLTPELVSRMKVRDEDVVAAALLRRIESPARAAP
ncbi:MAG TPA: hypothetical protein VFB36_14960 [Nevskiaceae bacterium]|nr:hypothetical protein [Nevskiaceae bacterium]